MPSTTAPPEWRRAFLRALGAGANVREAGANPARATVRAAKATAR